MSTEIAIGRKTGVGPLQAYGRMDRRFSFLGWIATAVPLLVFSYYCVIGGWVVRYAWCFLFGEKSLQTPGATTFLENFLSEPVPLLSCFLIFMGISALIVLLGVEKGIEKASRVMMPILLFLILTIAIYSLTLSHTDTDGTRRTALEGLRIYLIPDFRGLTFEKLLNVLMDAVGQLFYSLSIAMGVMITFGSYAKRESDLPTAINRIEWFDTAIAVLSGLVVIPSVFVFQGVAGLQNSGPTLLFVSLPTVFEAMGAFGWVIGTLFFILVLFAALTSSVSLLEAVTASLSDRFHLSRLKSVLLCIGITLPIGGAVCLGYNLWAFEIPLPNGSTGTFLELLDYLCNSLLLPIVALLTCIMIGWFTRPAVVLDELRRGRKNAKFRRDGIFDVMLRFVYPIFLAVILLEAIGIF